jgi:hypothetical protein
MDLKGLLDAMEKMDVGAYLACPRCNIRGTQCKGIRTMTYRTDRHTKNQDAPPKDWYKDLVMDLFADADAAFAELREANPGLSHKEAMKTSTMKDLFKTFGWKISAVFTRLSYFDITEDCRIDIMHSFQNLGRRICASFLGDDMTDAMRQQARVLKERKSWWPGNPSFISPFAIPSQQLRTGGKFTKHGWSLLKWDLSI